jgi:UPF0755 protein
MTRRKIFRLAALALLLLAAVPLLEFGLFLLRPAAPAAPAAVELPPGTSLAEVARRLEAQGVVRSAAGFRLLARLRGASRAVQAGTYDFAAPATPGEVLGRLVAGDVRRLRLTIPEGWTLREIAARVEAGGLGSARTFLRLANDPQFIASLGISAASLEGYLFPETYLIAAGTPEERLIRTMVEQLRSRLAPDLIEGAAKAGLDLHDLLTLASIIQKEAGSREEMPLISAVFHNRLKRGMRLQADPTVIYGLARFNGNLTRRDLTTPTPYNTYSIAGLPPGPIASPGEEALRAAAFPASAGYLYFVARGDGTHVFSLTLPEHNRAVRRYQLRRREARVRSRGKPCPPAS